MAAVIVVVLSGTACANQSDAPYITGALHNEIRPLEEPVAEIDSDGAKCAQDLTTTQLAPGDEESVSDLRIRVTQLASNTVFVSSSDGFERIVAGIVIAGSGTRVPFSTKVENFKPQELSFIAKPEVFDMPAIVSIELCVNHR